MSESQVNALIGDIPGFFIALFALLTYLQSRKNGKTATATHDLVNSKMTELLASTEGRAHAEGVIAGTSAEQARVAEPGK